MADLPYQPFATQSPSGEGAPGFSMPDVPEASGAGVVRSLGRASQTLGEIGKQQFEQAIRFQQMDNETFALDKGSEVSSQLSDAETTFRQLKGLNAGQQLARFEADIQKIGDRAIASAPNLPTRLAVQRQFKNYSAATLKSMRLHAADQSDAANTAAAKGAIDAAKSRFVLHYGLSDSLPDIEEIHDLALGLAHSQGLPDDATNAFVQAQFSDAYSQVVNARIAYGHVDQAQAAVEDALKRTIPGTDIPLLDAKALATLPETLKQARSSLDAQGRAAREEQDRLDRQDYAKEVSKAMSTLQRPDGSLFVTPQYFQILQQAGTMRGAQIDPAAQRAALDFGHTLLNEQTSDEKVVSDPHTYDDFQHRVLLPVGDPARLSDAEIYAARFSKHLSSKDATAFLAASKDLAADPAKVEMEKRYQDFLNGMKPSIAKSDFFGNILDSDQAQRWYQYQSDTRQLVERAYKDGTWRELLDARSPRYMGKLIPNYTTTIKGAGAALKNKLQAGPQAIPAPPIPAGLVEPRKPGETPADYLKRTGGGR